MKSFPLGITCINADNSPVHVTVLLSDLNKVLLISPQFSPFVFLSRGKFSTLTTRQLMIEFYFSRSHGFRLTTEDGIKILAFTRIEPTTSALVGVQA